MPETSPLCNQEVKNNDEPSSFSNGTAVCAARGKTLNGVKNRKLRWSIIFGSIGAIVTIALYSGNIKFFIKTDSIVSPESLSTGEYLCCNL